MGRQTSEDVVKASEQIDDIRIQTADIQQRFKFFETYKEPEKARKEFRITPPRDGQVKVVITVVVVAHRNAVVPLTELIFRRFFTI